VGDSDPRTSRVDGDLACGDGGEKLRSRTLPGRLLACTRRACSSRLASSAYRGHETASVVKVGTRPMKTTLDWITRLSYRGRTFRRGGDLLGDRDERESIHATIRIQV
jgi:hypothetical protein